MIPTRWHVIFGALFTLLIWIFAPTTHPLHLGLVFISSFLIDFDHYLIASWRQKKLHPKHIIAYHRERQKKLQKEHAKGIKNKGDFHLFHTVEFLFAIAILGIFFAPFFFIFLGMIFHSMLDLSELLRKDKLYLREYFFTNWLWKNFREG